MPDCQPLSSGSLCPESSGLTTFLGWLSLTGMVAHFAPDWWLSMVRIIQMGNNSSFLILWMDKNVMAAFYAIKLKASIF